MSFLVFLRIVDFLEEPRDFLSLSLVCRSSYKACEHSKRYKKWHFERLFFAYDGEFWRIFTNHDEAQEFSVQRIQRGFHAISRHRAFEGHAVFKMRRIELFNIFETKRCSDEKNCEFEFQNK